MAAKGRSNDVLAVVDSTGRAYSLAPHTLPSARGQGEPLTGKLNPPEGTRFVGVVIGRADQRVLLASNAGYGFVAKLGDLVAKNRAGKAMLSVPSGGCALAPVLLGKEGDQLVVAITDQGRMLAFPIARSARTGARQRQQADQRADRGIQFRRRDDDRGGGDIGMRINCWSAPDSDICE